jgi:hypothetical protein
VNIVGGNQDGFDRKAFRSAVKGAAAGAFVDGMVGDIGNGILDTFDIPADSWAAPFIKGAGNYVQNYVTGKIAGHDVHFDWKDLAVQSVSTGINNFMDEQVYSGINDDVMRDTISGFSSAAVTGNLSRAWSDGKKLDWGQVAIDSFGNALANHAIRELEEKGYAPPARTSGDPLFPISSWFSDEPETTATGTQVTGTTSSGAPVTDPTSPEFVGPPAPPSGGAMSQNVESESTSDSDSGGAFTFDAQSGGQAVDENGDPMYDDYGRPVEEIVVTGRRGGSRDFNPYNPSGTDNLLRFMHNSAMAGSFIDNRPQPTPAPAPAPVPVPVRRNSIMFRPAFYEALAAGNASYPEIDLLNSVLNIPIYSENERLMASILRTEAGGENIVEQVAVGNTILNRMERNGTMNVADVRGGYARELREPSQAMLDLARQLLLGEYSDNTQGATHFYSPQSMPYEGGKTAGMNTRGGLEQVSGLDGRTYRHDWSLEYPRIIIPFVRDSHFRFYKQPPGTGPVR